MVEHSSREISAATGTVRYRLKNTFLHRIDGPAVEFKSGTKEWWENGLRHRIGKPAIEWAGGNEEWYVNGKRHREGAPAVILHDRPNQFWLNGVQLTQDNCDQFRTDHQSTVMAFLESLQTIETE